MLLVCGVSICMLQTTAPHHQRHLLTAVVVFIVQVLHHEPRLAAQSMRPARGGEQRRSVRHVSLTAAKHAPCRAHGSSAKGKHLAPAGAVPLRCERASTAVTRVAAVVAVAMRDRRPAPPMQFRYVACTHTAHSHTLTHPLTPSHSASPAQYYDDDDWEQREEERKKREQEQQLQQQAAAMGGKRKLWREPDGGWRRQCWHCWCWEKCCTQHRLCTVEGAGVCC